jgi:hypothetical protein
VTVTHQTKTIDGVPCVAVDDRLYLRGRLEERTTDWYSQDPKGNVWYFGENTAELDTHGHVTNPSGTWRAGVDGAKPGIYMPAQPHVGQSGLQEYYKGQAEDHFKLVSLFGTVAGPKSKGAPLTEERSPLEPGVLDHKMYDRGVGTVLEQTRKGGGERKRARLRHEERVNSLRKRTATPSAWEAPVASRAGSSSGRALRALRRRWGSKPPRPTTVDTPRASRTNVAPPLPVPG